MRNNNNRPTTNFSKNHGASSSSSSSSSQQSYMMVPATAVIEEGDERQSHYPDGATKRGDAATSPPSTTAHVLEVVDEEGAAHPILSASSMGVDNNNNNNNNSGEYVKGVVLEPSYNDVTFAAAFALNVLVTAISAFALGVPAVNSGVITTGDGSSRRNATASSSSSSSSAAAANGGEDDHVLQWFLGLLLLGSMWSFVALRALLWGALRRPTEFVRIAYFSAPLLLVASCAVLFSLGDGLSAVWASVGLLFSVLLLVGYRPLRKYVRFASATLHASAIAVQENAGTVAVSLGSVVVVMAWLVLWMLAFIGYIDLLDKMSFGDDSDDDRKELDNSSSAFLTFMAYVFVFSLYWGQQVIRNVVHFTTSGAVSTWWFMPSHEHDGPRAVRDSLRRATTYSFGSICMASLLNTIAETAEAAARSNDHQSLLTCIVVCLLSCVRAWLEYFNSFALVYAALYNSDYWTSGKQVVQLFKHAGWKTFINDALVFRVLFMTQFAAASLTGLSSMALFAAFGGGGAGYASSSGSDGASYGTVLALMYVAGFLMGIMASSPVLFVLESTTRTIMVCLAEQPYQFQNAHPELFELLTEGWAEAYPEAWQEQKVIAVAEPVRAPIV